MVFRHKPVLLDEVIEALHIRPSGIYVDGTLGGAGHAYEVCSRLNGGTFVGIDRDEDAVSAAGARLKEFPFAHVVRSNYSEAKEVLAAFGIEKVSGILLDLGVSSYQLDTPERGFSYKEDTAPLDMRMDNRMETTARDIVNGYSEAELFRIIRDYGEDPFAKNIAKHIVRLREKKELVTCGDLNEAVRAAIPMKIQKNLGHPSKRTFQAIRIELNGELKALQDTLDKLIDLLEENGRLCIITFHSLEDRIVKSGFRKRENPCECPPDFPVCVCGRKSAGRVITRKPILPGKEECEENKRAKSAKLRVFERG
ncbi:MAG: 16S rRNA (cytosine(1402)-N(4))-methyltransferase RsmH [Lachnospiraceae bacterium]|nr:16S rRNA (cytosine(1402)-N(4))-methyltransferase RsmH [Lachnospiraceae bacterium]